MVVQTNTDLVHLKINQNWFLSLQLAAMEDMRDTLPRKTSTSFVQKMTQIGRRQTIIIQKETKIGTDPSSLQWKR